jgi:hypothetical protein
MAHARRYFKEAMPTAAVRCAQPSAIIAQLYEQEQLPVSASLILNSSQAAECANLTIGAARVSRHLTIADCVGRIRSLLSVEE